MTLDETPCQAGSAKSGRQPDGAAKRRAAVLDNVVRNLVQWCRVAARKPRTRIRPLPAGATAVIAITLSAVIASMFVLDTAASDWAHHLPRWFVDIFEEITNFGLSGWFLFPFGFIILCLAAVASPALSRMTNGVVGALAARFGFLFLAIAAPSLFATIVKRLIGRARPYVGGTDDPFRYMPFIWRPEYASMPSGHATTAAAAAIALGAVWPAARVAMWLYALVIMFSRVVVLAHHPSDVIAGAMVGAVGALWTRRWFAARGLMFSADLAAYPWPSLRHIKQAACRIVLGR